MRATEILVDLRTYLEGESAEYLALAADTTDDRLSLDYSSKRGVVLNILNRLGSYGTPLDEIVTAPARSSDPSTSKAAAVAMSPGSAVSKLAEVFYEKYVSDVLLHRAEDERQGLAAWQAVERAGLQAMKAPWKRVSELGEAGIIEATGFTSVNPETGRKVQQLRLTAHGVAEVERLRAERQEARS